MSITNRSFEELLTSRNLLSEAGKHSDASGAHFAVFRVQNTVQECWARNTQSLVKPQSLHERVIVRLVIRPRRKTFGHRLAAAFKQDSSGLLLFETIDALWA